jgi:hypothetical protein
LLASAGKKYIDGLPLSGRRAVQQEISQFEKLLWWEKTVVIAFWDCDPFDCMGADSTGREESEVWRDEDLMGFPVHPGEEGNLSFDCFWGSSSCYSLFFLRLQELGRV